MNSICVHHLPMHFTCNAVLLCFFGQVVDAPDLSQISAMADKRSQVAKWKKMTSPGPSAILLAIRSDIKFRKADYDAYEEVKTLWGDDSSFCERLFVVFTYAEYILPNIENKKWESYPELDKVLVDANYRHAIISNKASAEEKEDAVKRILLNVAEIGKFLCSCLPMRTK